MELDDRPSPRLGHLESFKNRASFLLKDSLKIARLALVDVSTAELMTEEATNADEWGPTPKAMSDICSVIFNSEDYLRVVQVLHKRFSLNTKKYWRQIHKSLILLEYLLCHGPEHLVMEFREDKEQLEELARFVYVDWNGIDRGSAIQRRAKHVLHLLMDEAFYNEERRRAQKTSKVISGFGSQSFYHKAARQEHRSPSPHSKSDSELLEHDREGDLSTLLVDEDDENESSWGAATSPGDNQNAMGSSTLSNACESNPYEDSPTSVLSFRKSSLHLLDMDSLASEQKPAAAEDSPKSPNPPVLKLPPPPPVAEYKCITPQARVRRTQPGSVKPAHVIPDLILI